MSGGLFANNAQQQRRSWERRVARLTGGIGENDEPIEQPQEATVEEQQRDWGGSNDDESRKCWICYGSEADDEPGMDWLSPCRCRGSMKWVHDKCLQMYIDSRIGNDSLRTVVCPQCKTPYVLVFPKMTRTVLIMDCFDRLITRTCPYLAAGMLVGSVYWAAVTYGAVTVMQVAGQEEALQLMEKADPMFLLVGLPTIPVFLIAGKMIHWEEKVLIGIRAVTERAPFLGYILPGFRPRRPLPPPSRSPSIAVHIRTPASRTPVPQPAIAGNSSNPQQPPPQQANPQPAANQQPQQVDNNGDEQLIRTAFMATRVFCSALLFPAVASVMGKVFFSKTSSNWRRSLYGGVAFLAVKGAFKIYYLQNLHNIRVNRRVQNFSTPVTVSVEQGAASGNRHEADVIIRRREGGGEEIGISLEYSPPASDYDDDEEEEDDGDLYACQSPRDSHGLESD